MDESACEKFPLENGPELTPTASGSVGDLTFRERLGVLWDVAKSDFGRANLLGKSALAGTMLAAAYEWGPLGNETTAPIIAGQMINAGRGPASIAVSSLVTGGFVWAEQWGVGRLAAYNASVYPDTSKKTYGLVGKSEDGKQRFQSFQDLSGVRKVLYSFGFGTSFVVTREAFATNNNEQKQLRRVNRISSTITGSVVAIATAGVDIIDEELGNEGGVDIALGVAKNPIFWLGLSGLIMLNDYRKNRSKNKLSK